MQKKQKTTVEALKEASETTKKEGMRPRKSPAAIRLSAAEKEHAQAIQEAQAHIESLKGELATCKKEISSLNGKKKYLEDVVKKESSDNKALRELEASLEKRNSDLDKRNQTLEEDFRVMTQLKESHEADARIEKQRKEEILSHYQKEREDREAAEKDLERYKDNYLKLQAAALRVMQLPWYKRTYDNISRILLKNL